MQEDAEALARAVLEADVPAAALGEALAGLERSQQPELSAALYESVCYRVPVEDYWLHFRMWAVYHALGPAREDAAFLHAAAALRLHPDWSGAEALFAALFRIFVHRGQDRAALDLFRHQMRLAPDRPAASAWDLAPVLGRLGEIEAFPTTPPPPADPGARRLHPVQPEEIRPPSEWPVFGAAAPYSFEMIKKPFERPAITVGEFPDAELLLYRNSVVVVDRVGAVVTEFSVGEYPQAIREAFERDASAELYEADEAVVISDRHPPPNICHFLFDQVSRLALYRQAGVATGALVIGPEPGMEAQHEMLHRAGVAQYLGTDRIARVRVRRLWVSSNCRGLVHPGHLGAAWAMEFARDLLGGRGEAGSRRLFISRADAQGRRIANEDEVAALLARHGFETIVPGRMAYEDQLAAFREASHVVGSHGAALAHLVLCPKGARVLEMFHPLYGTAAYAVVAAASGLRYATLLGRDWASDAPEWNDPAMLAPEGSRFGDRHLRVDLPTLAAYLAT